MLPVNQKNIKRTESELLDSNYRASVSLFGSVEGKNDYVQWVLNSLVVSQEKNVKAISDKISVKINPL